MTDELIAMYSSSSSTLASSIMGQNGLSPSHSLRKTELRMILNSMIKENMMLALKDKTLLKGRKALITQNNAIFHALDIIIQTNLQSTTYYAFTMEDKAPFVLWRVKIAELSSLTSKMTKNKKSTMKTVLHNLTLRTSSSSSSSSFVNETTTVTNTTTTTTTTPTLIQCPLSASSSLHNNTTTSSPLASPHGSDLNLGQFNYEDYINSREENVVDTIENSGCYHTHGCIDGVHGEDEDENGLDYNHIGGLGKDVYTHFIVKTEDPIYMLRQLQKEGYSPVVVSSGNDTDIGGNFPLRDDTFEESLFIRSTLPYTLWPHRKINDGRVFSKSIDDTVAWYPLTTYGTIYVPYCAVFRDHHKGILEPLETVVASVITSSPQDLVTKSGKIAFSLEMAKEKLRSIFYVAALEKHDCIILDSFGCDHRENDPLQIANLLKKMLTVEDEFKNVFKVVVFALSPKYNTKKNFVTFKKAFNTSSSL